MITTNRFFSVNLLKKAEFWIILFFLLRLYGIMHPPLEVLHNIRQTDTLMIARNFHERDNSIFFPMADVAGEKSGIVGSEFPIFNYLIALVADLFGFDDWYGRLINLIVSSLGIWFFYKLIRKYFGEAAGFNAAILLLVSLWLIYSRKTMPDTFAASLCIISVYYAMEFLDHGKWHQFILYFLLGAAGALSKVSAIPILSVLAVPVFFGSFITQRKVGLVAAGLVILSAVIGWYYYWVPYLNETYGYTMFFMGMSFVDGIKDTFVYLPDVLARFYGTALKYTGFGAWCVGITLLVVNKKWLPLAIFGVLFCAHWLVIFKVGGTFGSNEYYVLVVIPAMAFIAGVGLAEIRNPKIVMAILLVVAIEGIANRIHDFRVKEPIRVMLQLEGIMDTVSDRTDLIAINGRKDANGTAMFFAHRRGWLVHNDDLLLEHYRNDLINKGCKYFLIVKLRGWEGDLTLPYEEVYNSEAFRIYKCR
ncbi:MAG TPA: glycosyltransferase family 39 protein [Chryseosolibacter sp.]